MKHLLKEIDEEFGCVLPLVFVLFILTLVLIKGCDANVSVGLSVKDAQALPLTGQFGQPSLEIQPDTK